MTIQEISQPINKSQEITSKICSSCGFIRPAHIDYFQKKKDCRYGVDSVCKKCMSINGKMYRSTNKEKAALFQKKYYLANKDKINKQNMENYKLNRTDRIEKQKIYVEKNKQGIAEYKKNYAKENKEKLSIKRKKYSKKNRTHIILYQRAHRRENAKYIGNKNKFAGIEDVRMSILIPGDLEVRCAYCGKFYIPLNDEVYKRIKGINNVADGSLFYCSDGCKNSCPIFGQKKFPKGFKKATSREANPLLRQLVLKRDDYTCQKCGATTGDKIQLHCHHVIPARQNPMTANDPDACITYCKKCHIAVHKTPGCKNHELKCKQPTTN